MIFSTKLATAVHILLYVEEYEDEEKITSEVLADSTGVNAVNIRKILASLKQAKIITVKPGVGGTYLAMKPEDITLQKIFEAVEETDPHLFRMHEHPNINCPVGKTINSVLSGRLDTIKNNMLKDMAQVRLYDIYRDMKSQLDEH